MYTKWTLVVFYDLVHTVSDDESKNEKWSSDTASSVVWN